LDCLTLEIRPICFPETLVTNYHPPLHHIPEDRRPQLHRD